LDSNQRDASHAGAISSSSRYPVDQDVLEERITCDVRRCAAHPPTSKTLSVGEYVTAPVAPCTRRVFASYGGLRLISGP